MLLRSQLTNSAWPGGTDDAPMPRVSVVVPVYNVESYLATCLQSLARQTVGDLEVIMVDDGSTDRSAAIAERFAHGDRRFRLVRQANGGLGQARNVGVATAGGEFVAFVDSDDIVPDDAYERLLSALDATGSDFATGNVLRLTRQGTTQAQFLARTFARTRLKTHVTRFRPLLADRTAWNKLWRRSFWEERELRFPEGVVHEDIPVTLPAHMMAASVDVIAAPVYHWRLREDGALSITQRRLELQVLRDRLTAIEHVRDHIARHGSRKLRRWYDASLVADDLRLHLNLLDRADEDYRALFVERVNALLADTPRRVFARLPAIDRLKWHLVGRGLVPELLEVLRFEREDAAQATALRLHGRFHGDYPFRTDPRLRIARSTYRLGRRDEDLALTARLEEVSRDGAKLRLRGHAYIAGIGADSPSRQRTTITALRPGRWRALRLRLAAVQVPTFPVHRADLTADRSRTAPDVCWAGFEATLDPHALLGGSTSGTWQLYASTRTGQVRRRRSRFELASADLLRAVDLPCSADVLARAAVSADGGVCVEVRTVWAQVRAYRIVSGDVELTGDLRLAPGGEPALELRRRSDALVLSYPLAGTTGFLARVPLEDLRSAPASLEALATGEHGAHELWELWLAGAGNRLAISLPDDLDGAEWRSGGHEFSMIRTRRGDAALVTRSMAPARASRRGPEQRELVLAGGDWSRAALLTEGAD